ncbi:MAG: hypothetical protein NVS3B25_34790 [Hymenobacter sp.]
MLYMGQPWDTKQGQSPFLFTSLEPQRFRAFRHFIGDFCEPFLGFATLDNLKNDNGSMQ